MSKLDEGAARALQMFKERVMLLAFGTGVLAFLIAIDRLDWFAIQPATAAAKAMARGAERAPVEPDRAAGTVGPRQPSR